MSSSSHLKALSAFEEDDPLVVGLQSKIANFQKNQKEQSKHEHDYYDWIHSGILMNDAEVATTKQILQACSNALELMQKEKDHEDHWNSCDIDHSSRVDSLRSDISIIQTPARDYSCKDNDIMSGISKVKLLGRQYIDGKSRDDNALCAKMLLDLREALAKSVEDIDETVAMQSSDAADHRRRVLLHLSHNLNEEFQKVLPISLARALDSLRSLLQENDHPDDGGEIDYLQSDLSRKFEDAHTEYNPNLLNAADLERKCQAIEKDGLEEVERLRELFLTRFQMTNAGLEANLKQKERKLRLRTLHHEREESQRETKRKVQATAKKMTQIYQNELKHTLKILESKHAVLKHRAEQTEVQQEILSNRLKDDFADEIESRRRQHTNQKRSNFRKARLDSKVLAMKTTKEEATRAEEARIEAQYNRRKCSV
ncbi:hypothetical protein ACHAXA_002830 [Cyclostephanos tholiformis]|uniref:Uncharacterized protein n=1 Tax=Cyclostephanos tholiformis TaxID=382380 RepID=A0ABD3RZR1_9STRA